MAVFTKKGVKKFGFRVGVITGVYLLIKLTIDHNSFDEEHMADGGIFNPTSLFYYSTAFFLFMLTWESNDWLVRRQLKSSKGEGLDLKNSLRILFVNMLIFIPAAALVYYLGIYVFDELCQISPEDRGLRFRIDFFRAMLLGFTVVIFNLFYHSMRQKRNIEQKMADLTREVTASKYNSLKSQISPHFLFNSLNTLTSLMYEDRDLASDFVSRLASSYRYILDNREEDLVSLEKELNFLDSFNFMMKVRHRESITIETRIDLDPSEFKVPTLSLQMLVENAMKHNYYSPEKPLEIYISTIGNEALSVKNNLRKRELKEETTKLGLKNIRKRYSFYTNKQVLIREDRGDFEVIIPLLGREADKMKILAIS